MGRPWLLLASAGFTAGALLGPAGVVATCVATALVAGLARERWLPLVLVGVLFAASGFGRATMYQTEIVGDAVLASERAMVVVTGQPQVGPAGDRAVVRVERVMDDDGAWVDTEGEVLLFFRDTVPGGITGGERIQVAWAVSSLQEQDPRFRQFVRFSGAGGTATAFDTDVIARGGGPGDVLVRLRMRVTRGITRAIDGDAGALLAGFVTGDDSGLSDETRIAFERTNTSHITAVSGSNVAVLLSLWYIMMPTRRLQRSLPAMLGILAIVWCYVILVGMGPGAVRAGLFATLLLPAARLGRRPDALTALMLASALMLLARPAYVDSVGFWLSMAASTAMVTVLSTTRHGPAGAALSGLVGLVAAQIATLPITMLAFDQWSPSSLIANLAIGPLVAAFFPFAFITAIGVTALPWLGALLGWLPALGATAIISIVESMASDFPLVRTGEVGPLGAVLIAAPCVAIVAVISADARRWLERVGWSRPQLESLAAPIVVGAGLGIWLGTMAFAALP